MKNPPRLPRKPKTLQRIRKNTEEYRRKKGEIIKELPSPEPGKQLEYYNAKTRIAFACGATGTGKTRTTILYLGQKRFIKNKRYRGVIFRKNTTHLSKPGGVLDETKKFYYDLYGDLAMSPQIQWRFPSGATITLSHLQHEKNIYDWKSSSITSLVYEELTEFSENKFFYITSRQRRDSKLPITTRATMNPDASSWVAGFLDWYIGEDGFPLPDRNGAIRFFVRPQEGEFIWSKDPDDLKRRYPELEPISFCGFFMTLEDNPKYIEMNPDYIAFLKAQHPVERARLLYGNWKTKYEAGTVFNSTWFRKISLDDIPEKGRIVRFYDLAATPEEEAKPQSFYSCGFKMMRSGGTYYVIDIKFKQIRPGEILDFIKEVSVEDGDEVMIRWEQEPGSSGETVRENYVAQLLEFNPTLNVEGVATGNRNKISRAIPFATAAYNGDVYVAVASWNSQFFNAVQEFDGTKKKPLINDIVDAGSGAFNVLFAEGDHEFDSSDFVEGERQVEPIIHLGRGNIEDPYGINQEVKSPRSNPFGIGSRGRYL